MTGWWIDDLDAATEEDGGVFLPQQLWDVTDRLRVSAGRNASQVGGQCPPSSLGSLAYERQIAHTNFSEVLLAQWNGKPAVVKVGAL